MCQVLYFVYKELALGYLLFSFLAALGVLQWTAARYRLAGLSFLDYSRRRIWGYALGTFLVLGSAIWFFVNQWARIFTPGPAGSELALLFGSGAVLALIATLVAGTVRWRLRRGGPREQVDSHDEGEIVAIGRATGRLYLPPNPTAPVPAVCIVPGLGAGSQTCLHTLARHLVQLRLVALVINPDAELYSYPETLAILPAATSFLSKRPDVDPQRLGAIGYDLGGDLVIRAASADKHLKAVAALAPVLVDSPVGLHLMSEMAYTRAWRWSRDRQRAQLRAELNAAEHAAKIAPRPLLLLYGAEDSLVTRAPLEKWEIQGRSWVTLQSVQGAGHLDVLDHPLTLHTVAHWFKERL